MVQGNFSYTEAFSYQMISSIRLRSRQHGNLSGPSYTSKQSQPREYRCGTCLGSQSGEESEQDKPGLQCTTPSPSAGGEGKRSCSGEESQSSIQLPRKQEGGLGAQSRGHGAGCLRDVVAVPSRSSLSSSVMVTFLALSALERGEIFPTQPCRGKSWAPPHFFP